MTHILKANGNREEFSDEKVLNSIRRAGINEEAQLAVLQEVKSHLYDDIPSSEIYARIIDSLSTNYRYARTKYSLKWGLMMLGPTGYPFEDFVSKVLEETGYTTQVRQSVFGKCIRHEIDVIAEKEGKKIMVEAKYHNSPGSRSEIHVALYTSARFQDVKEKFSFDEAWIVTNTKATADAVTYAECVGMKIISWSHPAGGSLRDLIEKSGLHPITILSTLTLDQKKVLLGKHFVMCKDLRDNPDALSELSLSDEHKTKVLEELHFVCDLRGSP